jgi:hypothetical protein
MSSYNGFDLRPIAGYKMIPNSIYDDLTPSQRILYVDLHHMAVTKDGYSNHYKLNLKAGQLAIALSYLIRHFGDFPLTSKVLRNRLNELKNMGLLDIETAKSGLSENNEKITQGRFKGKHGMLITINNYNSLRNPKFYGDNEKARDGQCDGDEGAEKELEDGNNLNKETKKQRKKKGTCTSSRDDDKSKQFALEVQRIWNEYAASNDNNISPIRVLNKKRRQYIEQYRKDMPDLEQWEAAIETVFNDDFWLGLKPGSTWTGNFDSFIRPTKNQPLLFYEKAVKITQLKSNKPVVDIGPECFLCQDTGIRQDSLGKGEICICTGNQS